MFALPPRTAGGILQNLKPALAALLVALFALAARAEEQVAKKPAVVDPGDDADAEADDAAEEAKGRAELEAMRKAEAQAGLLAEQAGGRDGLTAGLSEMNPLAQDLGAALGPSVDGSPLADPSSAGSVFASLPELAGISEAELRAKYDIPVELNDAVVAYVRFFQTDVRAHFEKWLSRSTRFMPMMRQILEKEGLPVDLVYLSMIESGFNAYAFSFAKASGLWQFMVGTSRQFGLTSDFWVDERRDPEKATLAAAKYLRALHRRFAGDWFLAWAGYNAGEGKINKAIRKDKTTDFWAMRYKGRTLRAETKHYVPKLIAAALVAKHPERFGFHVAYEQPWQVDEVRVEGATDLRVIARAAGIPIESVRDLNPALRRSCTPPGGWILKLPKGTAKTFTENFARIPLEERLQTPQHKVEKGESLSKIARAYGVSEKTILSANRLRSHKQVRLGTVLVIPVGKSAALAQGKLLEDKPGPRSRAQGRAVLPAAKKGQAKSVRAHAGSYRVHPGESLWTIAKKFGTTVEQLKELNGLNGRKAQQLRVGQELAVRDG